MLPTVKEGSPIPTPETLRPVGMQIIDFYRTFVHDRPLHAFERMIELGDRLLPLVQAKDLSITDFFKPDNAVAFTKSGSWYLEADLPGTEDYSFSQIRIDMTDVWGGYGTSLNIRVRGNDAGILHMHLMKPRDSGYHYVI